jgi:hypothetical protein
MCWVDTKHYNLLFFIEYPWQEWYGKTLRNFGGECGISYVDSLGLYGRWPHRMANLFKAETQMRDWQTNIMRSQALEYACELNYYFP